MSDTPSITPAGTLPLAPPAVRGRSLWDDARTRLASNRAAMAGLIWLALVAVAAIVGPMVAPHGWDRVYPDYVKVDPSLTAYPLPDQAEAVLKRIASRFRAPLETFRLDGERFEAVLAAPRPIDERIAEWLDRADLFKGVTVTARADEGRRLTLAGRVERVVFPFGTDANGRDLLTRTLVAGRVSLAIGALATLVALLIGVTWGSVSGYAGGRVDAVMMRIVDVLYSLPFTFFVIMLVVFFGRNFILMFLAVGAIEWLDMARIVRGQTLSIKRQEYVQAAEALGVSPTGILRRHIVPNTLGPVVVYMTLMVPKVILLESFLSFLGLGVQEPMTSWGVLIAEGANNIQGSIHLLIFPAAFLVTTLLALNFVGDGLRDALDPRDR